MKSVNEIKEAINFPKFTDIFGNEINAGDVIGMTSTGNKQISAYLVTNRFTNGNRLIMINILHPSWKGYLDINELNEKTCQHWSITSIVKLNDSLPQYLKDTAKQLSVQFIKEAEQKKIDAVEKRKSVIQERYFPIFMMNKETKQAGIIFALANSQPGKVISKTDLINIKNNLIKNYPNHVMNIIDSDGALIPIDSKNKFKPELHSLRIQYWFSKTPEVIKFDYSELNDISCWNISNHKNDIFNKFIPIYNREQAKNINNNQRSTIDSHFSDDRYHYAVQFNSYKNENSVTKLGRVFSNQALEKFNAFYNYYK